MKHLKLFLLVYDYFLIWYILISTEHMIHSTIKQTWTNRDNIKLTKGPFLLPHCILEHGFEVFWFCNKKKKKENRAGVNLLARVRL